MIRIFALLSFAMALGAAALPADTVKGVILDNVCAAEFSGDFAAAVEHSKTCSLLEGGKKKGFSIVSEDGQTLTLDAKGNSMLLRSLQYSKKTGEIQVEAEGKVKGSKIAVQQIRIS
ncbi:MAG: hypothetical protein GC160_18685 [Acidobacteria bacterium]|nr:hypothetical protein [Acidobacteriota bacterium]